MSSPALAPATCCRHCGCTDDRACHLTYRATEARPQRVEACWWIMPGLCSNPACLDAEVLNMSAGLDELRELANLMSEVFFAYFKKKGRA